MESYLYLFFKPNLQPKVFLLNCLPGRHVCPYCQKVFAKRIGLQRHVLIHDDAKPHVCEGRCNPDIGTLDREQKDRRGNCCNFYDGYGELFH